MMDGAEREAAVAAAFAALQAGDAAALHALLARDPALAAARDSEGVSLLLRARYAFRLDLVDMLMAAEPELDLFTAAALGRAARAAALLAADPTQVGAIAGDGFTPLHLAAFFAQPEMVLVLLERGAEIEVVSRNAMAIRPLHAAAAGGSPAVVEILLARGADPNARQHGGWTALAAAAASGSMNIVRVLIACGARPALATADGKTPVDLAREHDYLEIARWLAARAPAWP
jgi:ankyrin repeat protein